MREYFYCYSYDLYKHLKFEKGIPYICTGLHEHTLAQFWLFKYTTELTDALKEYTINHKAICK